MNRLLALNDQHLKLGAKMMPFAGWSVPISYGSAVAEHRQVRAECGIFDVSHMGEIFVSGGQAIELLQYLTINDVKRLTDGQGQYSAMLNDHGGFIDDLIIYRLSADNFLLCVNAGNRVKCLTHIIEHQQKLTDVQVSDRSDDFCQFAVQGPTSKTCLNNWMQQFVDLETLDYLQITEAIIDGMTVYLARSGYTGEKGYELYVPNDLAEKVWQQLLSSGSKAIGFVARDTLRLEACYLLYGNDIDDQLTPYEAGIGWAVKINKGDFIGKETLLKATDKTSKIVAFKMVERGFPRHGMTIFSSPTVDDPCGQVTSGAMLPTVGCFGGLALLQQLTLTEFYVNIRGKYSKARVVNRPMYQTRCRG